MLTASGLRCNFVNEWKKWRKNMFLTLGVGSRTSAVVTFLKIFAFWEQLVKWLHGKNCAAWPKDTIKRFQPFVPNLLWCQVKLHCERPNSYNKNMISLVQLTLKTYGWATAVIKFKIESACLILVETGAMFFVVSKRSPCCEIRYLLGIF